MTEAEVNARIDELIAACLGSVISLSLLHRIGERAKAAYDARLAEIQEGYRNRE